MKLIDALNIVLDLASENTLDERDCDGDYNLLREAKRQDEAINMVSSLAGMIEGED